MNTRDRRSRKLRRMNRYVNSRGGMTSCIDFIYGNVANTSIDHLSSHTEGLRRLYLDGNGEFVVLEEPTNG